MADTASLIFITGGVRSGKSRFAERMAEIIAARSGRNLYYIATGVPFDSEMRERIKKHQQDRENQKVHWNTIEQSISIGNLADQVHDRDILLLDCVTTLLNNELYSSRDISEQVVYDKMITGILALKRQAGTLIVVSNEVLNEPIVDNVLVQSYKRLLGSIHQRLVESSDQAYLVEAGIPIAMKKVIT
ncbi:bifunctional adenosylcobinamide kinase/adenosylcobinamide-phosphate guanylyltransferase [Bacillus sp. USDA818B3_A]|uniref:bifunctional adenosylcobinamide kinase/adenosylcobinamide-phosphate guanylyltransferase n=1 Tax=Bacillus sp. USDA818B3_A TaxID=2698834 RepID=UPI00136F463E|nr:bifunctional adenosylcobinamide kinase/adenosylcobinamide-phosphate guanylyltransferase [Bacillus sp. USDA818B3_A]